MPEFAQQIDSIPLVRTTAERGTRFPNPSPNQRVQNLETGAIERFSTNGWVGTLSSSLNVMDFGAVGDGVTDDTSAIQAAIDACRTAGGGVVYLPPGTYQLVHRLLAVYGDDLAYCLTVPSNVTIKGAGAHATILKLPIFTVANTTGYDVNWRFYAICTTRPNDVDTFENIAFADFTIDGQGVLQTIRPPSSQHALYMGRARRVWHTNMAIKNVYGLGSDPADETFCFTANNSADVHYVNCEAYTDDGGTNTATGFSLGQATNAVYSNCIAHSLATGMGFTNFFSSGITYASCRAYLCGANGFNAEVSTDVTYASCVGGGQAQNATTNPFFTDEASLGNDQHGFYILGSKRVTITSCVATYNATSGIRVQLYAPTEPSNKVVISGTVCAFNTEFGIRIDGGTQTDIIVDPSCVVRDNTGGDYIPSMATDTMRRVSTAPIDVFSSSDLTSGYQMVVQNAAANSQFRFLKNGSVGYGTLLLSLTDDGALGIPDGITAPAAATGLAKLYVDTADGDLKVIFADGTVKTIVVDT